MKFKIEKNVPLVKDGRTERRSKYPFADMKKGDSFFIKSKDRARSVRISLSSAAYHYVNVKAPDRKFTIRQVDGGFRVWRIK